MSTDTSGYSVATSAWSAGDSAVSYIDAVYVSGGH